MNNSNNEVSKYKDLLSSGRPSENAPAPIIRPPKILSNLIELDNVSSNGVVEKQHVNTTNGNGHKNQENSSPLPTPSLPRKRSANNSLLSDLLTDNSPDLLPYVLQFGANDCTYPDESNKYKPKTRMIDDHQVKMAKLALNDLDSTAPQQERPSRAFSDYFVVQFESTRQLENAGADNSLFLLIARALLYKLNFVDESYEAVLRNHIFQGLLPKDYRFDSDMSLQELVRKRLCLYWLSYVRCGKFIREDCKYLK